MGRGQSGYLASAVLAIGFAFIAKDLLVPFLGVAALGLFDRLIGNPMLRNRAR